MLSFFNAIAVLLACCMLVAALILASVERRWDTYLLCAGTALSLLSTLVFAAQQMGFLDIGPLLRHITFVPFLGGALTAMGFLAYAVRLRDAASTAGTRFN